MSLLHRGEEDPSSPLPPRQFQVNPSDKKKNGDLPITFILIPPPEFLGEKIYGYPWGRGRI